METLRVAPCLLLTLLLITTVFTATIGSLTHEVISEGEAPPYGPWVDRIVFSEVPEETDALEKLNAGDLHLWLYLIETPEALLNAEALPNVDYCVAYSAVYNLFINPLPYVNISGEPRFNPFGIREVREALNWLVDREYIAEDVLGGLGYPVYTVYMPYVMADYDRLRSNMTALEKEYSHDFDKAKEAIFNALTAAGCTLEGGKWYDPEGNPIEIYFMIRVEDMRKDIGDYVANLLEDLGFTVHRDYGTLSKVIPKVYGGVSDWHLYTETWAFPSVSAYEDDIAYYMYCSPWSGAVFQYYTPEQRLKELAENLLNAEYRDMDERLSWIAEVTELCLKDSTRVWLALQVAPFPYNVGVEGIAYDLATGFWSMYTLRTARFSNITGGTLRVGIKAFPADAFNPVGGFRWLYSLPVRHAIMDYYGVYPHSHTAIYLPIRANFTVETAGPDGTLSVPEDALIFDPATSDWRRVGPGVTAKSAVVFSFKFGRWHHGQNMTLADIFAWVAHIYLVAYEGSSLYDPWALTPEQEQFIDVCKGILPLDSSTVIVYVDYWHIDDSFIAAAADVWTGVPWELLALMDSAVSAKELAFSDSRAGEWGVDWLDLAKGPSLSILASHLAELKSANFIPAYMTDPDLPSYARITSDMASSRWNALNSWYSEHGHFMVSNGPFYLESINPSSKMIEVAAFRQYPYRADYLDELLGPSAMARYIPPASLKISCSCSSTYIGFRVSIYGNFTYQNGTGVSGENILLSYSVTGGETWNDITVVTTDVNGSFYAEWIPPATGDFLIRAVWIRDSTEMPISATISLSVLPYQEQYVFSVESNSTITGLAFNSTSKVLSFSVSGPANTTGYCKVTISKDLISDASGIKVYLDGNELNYTVSEVDESWVLYFVYKHSTHLVEIKLETKLVYAPTVAPWPKWMPIAVAAIVSACASALVTIFVYRLSLIHI